jgi:hypothetical protein
MTNKTIDDHVEVHCPIPLKSSNIVSVGAYQGAMKAAKNKGQRLRVAIRTLDKLGYNSNADEDFLKVIREYREDYDG